MADADTQEQTTPAPPDLSNLSQDTVSQALKVLLNQPLPNVQPDQTPVDTSGFWGGLRHGVSLLGHALGGGGDVAPEALSPAQKEQAGIRALSNFSTGLMAASRYSPGSTAFSNIAQGLESAQQGYAGSEKAAVAQLAGQQQYQIAQRADQLARIKEAIPLLTLQANQRAAANAANIALGNKPAPGTSIAEGGSVSVPPEYLPFYQEASARTGIPAEVLIAQSRQESGFNPGATGAAGEIGIGQISPKTATDPGYGMTGLKNPDALRDPRTNINFQADYLAARAKAAGADFSTPEGIAKALKAYNGGGDPNYVQNVTRYIPGARTALTPRPAPGQTAAATPPGPLPVPPIPSANPPPVAPPVAPPVQTAGPGAGNAPVMPPDYVPPQPGAVVRPAEGAPDQTAPVVPAPGATLAPAPQQGPTPINPYGPTWKPLPTVIPNDPRYDPNTLPPAVLDGFNRQIREIQGMPGADTAAKIAAVEQLRNAALIAQAKSAADARAEYTKNDVELQRGIAQHLNDQQVAQQVELQKQDNARQTAADLAKSTAQQSELTSNLEIRKGLVEKLNATSMNSTEAMQQLQTLIELSHAAGAPSLLPQGLRDYLVKAGVATPEQVQTWSAQQALTAANNRLLGVVRQGTGFSRTTNMDLGFLQNAMPGDADTNEAYRNAKSAFLLSAFAHQRKYADAVQENLADGMKLGAAQDKADADLGHVLKQVPNNNTIAEKYGDFSPTSRDKWIFDNLEPGQFYRNQQGNLRIFTPGNATRPE